MRVEPIRDPLPDERVVGIDPPLGIAVPSDWRRRLNLFAGRALGEAAMGLEPFGRAGRLALSGQGLEPGPVAGLEARWVVDAGPPVRHALQIEAGFGLSASGEDVRLSRAVRLAFDALPIRVLEPRAGGGFLRVEFADIEALRAAGAAVPPVTVAVLEPIVADVVDERARALLDQCEPDPRDTAFLDEQVIEGCRILLVAWPESWRPLPAAGPDGRNRIAFDVFDAEASLEADAVLPWEESGVPVALIGHDAAFVPQLLDRHAVVRLGGAPRGPRPLVTGVGGPRLWRARMLQLVEHLADLHQQGLPADQINAQLRMLPPVGLVSIDRPDLFAGVRDLFAAGSVVDVIPAPLEELDALSEAAAALAPFDRTVADQARIVVPVPEALYEPDLLRVEPVDEGGEFARAIQAFESRRGKWLRRRLDGRAIRDALDRAVTGEAPPAPGDDPDALDPNEPVDADPIDPDVPGLDQPEETFGTERVDGDVRVKAMAELAQALRTLGIADREIKPLEALGLERFLQELRGRIDHADDTLDLGFLRVQTDMYRMRQFLLGNEAATRLATSPVLAEIAKGMTARATKQELGEYLAAAKGKRVNPDAARPLPREARADAVFGPAAAPEIDVRDRNVPRLGARAGVGVAAPFAARGPVLAKLVANVKVEAADRADVTEQAPIVGRDFGVRTATVAQRLAVSPALEAKDFAVSSKHEVLSGLAGLDLARDIAVPGFEALGVAQGRLPLGRLEPDILQGILAGRFDSDPVNGDEAQYLGVGIKALEDVLSALRLVEGRVHRYKTAVDRCQKALEELRSLRSRVALRLQVIAGELAEARHDLAIARSLLRDEEARVGEVNRRRKKVLDNHVPFLMFYRPRTVEDRLSVPSWPLDPVEVAAPIPACLGGQVAVPAGLRAYVDLLRHAPADWFAQVPQLLLKLDRIDLLHRTLADAKLRAEQHRDTRSLVAPLTGPVGFQARSIERVLTARSDAVAATRLALTGLDLGALANLSWADLRDRTARVVSLGDLIDAGHGRRDVAGRAAAELERIAHVAGCLFDRLDDVLPSIRLEWADQLSQYDDRVPMRDLGGLPRWAELPRADRRALQALADWLYQRMKPGHPEAEALIDDLVRVAILVASHAPIEKVLAGTLPKPTTVRPGTLLDLSVDVSRARIGMRVSVFRDDRVVAQGVVEDLRPGGAVARVLQTKAEGLDLDKGTRVHLT